MGTFEKECAAVTGRNEALRESSREFLDEIYKVRHPKNSTPLEKAWRSLVAVKNKKRLTGDAWKKAHAKQCTRDAIIWRNYENEMAKISNDAVSATKDI